MKRRVRKYCKHEFKRIKHELVCVNCGEVARNAYTTRTHSLRIYTVEKDMDRIKYKDIEKPQYGKKPEKSGLDVATLGGRRLHDDEIAKITQAPKIAMKMEKAVQTGEIPRSESWRVASLAKDKVKLKGEHTKKLRSLVAPKLTVCGICHITFPYVTNPSLRCPRCKEDHKRRQARDKKRRQRAKKKRPP